MYPRLEIEFADGDKIVWTGWKARLLYPIVIVIGWYRVIVWGNYRTIKEYKQERKTWEG